MEFKNVLIIGIVVTALVVIHFAIVDSNKKEVVVEPKK